MLFSSSLSWTNHISHISSKTINNLVSSTELLPFRHFYFSKTLSNFDSSTAIQTFYSSKTLRDLVSFSITSTFPRLVSYLVPSSTTSTAIQTLLLCQDSCYLVLSIITSTAFQTLPSLPLHFSYPSFGILLFLGPTIT